MLALLLAGCTTSVTVSYRKPSRVNMGPYRTLAVASVRDKSSFLNPPFFIRTADPESADKYSSVFSSYSADLSKTVAGDATGMLMKSLGSAGFFDIVPPESTDKILGGSYWGVTRKELFEEKGVDAVLIPKIETMTANEWISSRIRESLEKDENGNSVTKTEKLYFYEWEIYLRISYTIIDSMTEEVIAKNSFDGRLSGSSEITTELFSPNIMRSEYGKIVSGLVRSIRNDLIPATYEFNVSLMKDKTGIPEAVRAYEDLEDGKFSSALDGLLSVWESHKSVPAGYNAAVLIVSTGDFERAISLLDEVIGLGGGKDAAELRMKLASAWKDNALTEDMLGSGKPEAGSGYDIYDTVGL